MSIAAGWRAVWWARAAWWRARLTVGPPTRPGCRHRLGCGVPRWWAVPVQADEGGVDVVAHGVGDRQVQGVVAEGVVVGVAGHAVRRCQGAGEGELGRLRRRRGGQEPALDLGARADRAGALPPLVEVGEAAVGDDDVRQRVRGLLDLLQDVVGGLGQEQLQDAEGVAAVGDRSEDPVPVLAVGDPHRLLGAQDLVVDAAGQRDLVGTDTPLRGHLLADPHHLAADDSVNRSPRACPPAPGICRSTRSVIRDGRRTRRGPGGCGPSSRRSDRPATPAASPRPRHRSGPLPDHLPGTFATPHLGWREHHLPRCSVGEAGGVPAARAPAGCGRPGEK